MRKASEAGGAPSERHSAQPQPSTPPFSPPVWSSSPPLLSSPPLPSLSSPALFLKRRTPGLAGANLCCKRGRTHGHMQLLLRAVHSRSGGRAGRATSSPGSPFCASCLQRRFRMHVCLAEWRSQVSIRDLLGHEPNTLTTAASLLTSPPAPAIEPLRRRAHFLVWHEKLPTKTF